MLMNRPVLRSSERGASAILAAASLLTLIGIAAVAIDLGAGYNERRQDQTAVDLGAVSGAIAFISPTSSDSITNEVLAIVEENLDSSFSASEWETAWSSCTDPGAYNPLPAPAAWSAATLSCISANSDTIRVRVPDQIIDTAFASAIGSDELRTSAVAEAKYQYTGTGKPKPFGLLNGLPAGETCLTQPATGQAMDACDGNSSGNFGMMLSDTWALDGDTVVDCGTPGENEVQIAVALGMDHPIGTVAPGLIPGSGAAWQSPPASNTRLDDCTPSGGIGVPSDSNPNYGPVNTMLASTGNNFAKAVEVGLITGEPSDFVNAANPATVAPLLQQVGVGAPSVISTREIQQKQGSTTYSYIVDNTPLWEHLRDWSDIQSGHSGAGMGAACKKADIAAAPIATDAMSACLVAYETAVAGGATIGDLFKDSISGNPRFGWAPQFHHTTWGSGSHWQPIKEFRPIYINRIWFNCNGKYGGPLPDSDACNDKGKGLIFEPKGTADESLLKVGSGGSVKALRMDQVTGFLLPKGSLPDWLEKSFPGGVTAPIEVVISR
jgi:hypothetical protein